MRGRLEQAWSISITLRRERMPEQAGMDAADVKDDG